MNMKKSLLAFVLWGAIALGVGGSAYAGGIDLSKAANNYGIVAHIEARTGMLFTGMMFVVDSSSTLDRDAASAGNFKTPFSTIDYAIGRASARTANAHPAANSGSLILVLPGHAETITAADQIDADLAGLTIWGVGAGADRPTLTYTVAAGEYTMGANNSTVGNIRFLSSVTDVLKAINVEDSVLDAKILNCWFGVDSSGTDEFTDCINFGGTNTRFVVEGNTMDMGIGGAIIGVHIDDDCAQGIIANNVIRGDYSTANIAGDSTLSTNILIEDNLLVNGVGGNLNAQPCIELLTGTTGTIRNNDLVCDETSPNDAIVADTCLYFGNRYSETIAGNSTDMPLIGQSYIQVAVKNAALDDADDLFDVTVGSVIVYALYATCEVDGTASPVVSLLLDAAVDVVLATGINISAVNTTDTITITNGALAINAPAAATAVMLPMVIKVGVIESILDSGSSGAGVLMWHCIWAPLDDGALVAEAT